LKECRHGRPFPQRSPLIDPDFITTALPSISALTPVTSPECRFAGVIGIQ
jgi:hypothetical protein